MTKSLIYSIVRAAVAIPATMLMIMHRPTKVDACYTSCEVSCNSEHDCTANCIWSEGSGSEDCHGEGGGTGAPWCVFEDSNCFS